MAVRSSNPLTAATTTILMPELREHGFQRISGRRLARIQNDILQFFDVQLQGYGSKTFCVNYASLSLFFPREHLILQPGARLNGRDGAEAWLSAKTQEDADTSMAQVVAMIQTQALPFFEATKSVAGLSEWLNRENWGSRHHLLLERAFCEARLGQLREANANALQAIELYREDGRAWCSSYIDLAQRLIAAIEGDELVEMFSRWIDHSVSKLRLTRFRV